MVVQAQLGHQTQESEAARSFEALLNLIARFVQNCCMAGQVLEDSSAEPEPVDSSAELAVLQVE